MVVLDDLHWADTSTLRVLRLLVETTDQARLLVVTTWRAHPEPTGALADVAEALARMHALRLAAVRTAAGPGGRRSSRASPAASSTRRTRPALHERTDGNPFFLVEFARLAGERGEPGAPPDELPTAVTDVLNRRLLRLPERTVTALRGGRGDRPDVRHPDAGDGHRDRRGRPARRRRAGAGGRAGPRGRHRPVPVRARPGPRHPARRDERQPAGPRCTPGSRRRSTGAARPGDRGGPALARGGSVVRRPRLARRGGRRGAGPAALRLRPGRRAAPGARWSRSTATPRPTCASGTTC